MKIEIYKNSNIYIRTRLLSKHYENYDVEKAIKEHRKIEQLIKKYE